MSVTMRLPDSSVSTALRGGPSATASDSTVSPKRNVTLRSRIWWISSSTISRSRNSSGRSRLSTSVTCDAERGEHRGVLDPDDAGADHGQASAAAA